MSDLLIQVIRLEQDYNYNAWPPSLGRALCERLVGAPLRAYMSEPGKFCHPPEGEEAPESIIGQIQQAWLSAQGEVVLAIARLHDTPRAQAVERGLRRMQADGILTRRIGCSIMAQVGFRIAYSSLPITRVDSVESVDLVLRPAADGWVLRVLEDNEAATTPATPATPAERNAT